MNNAAVNTPVEVFVKTCSYISCIYSWIIGNSMFNILRTCLPGCFSEQLGHLHSYRQCKRFQISLHLHQHLLFVFFILDILAGVKWCHCCFDLHFPSDYVKHHFTCLFIDRLFIFFGKNVFSYLLSVFKVGLFGVLLSYKSSLHILDTIPVSDI